jgi:hypothetical protein
MNLLEEHARELLQMPQTWGVYRFTCVPQINPTHVHLYGAVAPDVDGKTDWKKMDKTSKREVLISHKDHAEWIKQWEVKTGKCAECKGTGKRWIGWGKDTGSRYKPCEHCKATGKQGGK